MSSWGSFDYKEFEAYAKKLNAELKRNSAEAFLRDLMNEIGQIIIANVKENSPVGQYNDGWVRFVTSTGDIVEFWATAPNRQGGLLRDSWFVADVSIKNGKAEITISNSVYYAEWVENGHRLVNGGWLEGQFMLRETLEDLNDKLSAIVKPKYVALLERMLT